MKVLMLASYIFEPGCAEFEKNRTGFGMMVKDIIDFVGKKEEVIFSSRVITNGRSFENYKILKHTFSDIFKSARPRDYIRAISAFFYGKYAFKDRLRNAFYDFDGGYVRTIIKSERPDIVHIHGIGPITKSYIDICLELKVPFVVTLHGLIGLDNSVLAPASTKRLEKEFLIKAQKENIPVTVISSGMKKRIEENYLLKPADNITVVLNGTKSVAAAVNTDDIFTSLGIENKKICLAIGNICERKNQIEIVRAWGKLPDDLRKQSAVLMCGNDLSNGEMKKEIEKINAQSEIFILGFVEKKRVEYLLENASLNIVASLDEGFGLSIIEAFSHGVPTVTFSDLDAVPDLLSDCAMLLTKSRKTEDFSIAIASALLKEWDKEKIKKHAESFTMESTADKYIEVYKNSI